MLEKNHSWSIYLIVLTIVLSLIIQGYWNYKNYLENKKTFITNVQHSLDNATDNYFAKRARKEFNFSAKKINTAVTIKINNSIDSITLDTITNTLKNIVFAESDSLGYFSIKQTVTKKDYIDSVISSKKNNVLNNKPLISNSNSLSIFTDSLKTMKGMQSIYISIFNENIHLEELKPLLITELNRNNINIPFKINNYYNNKLISTTDTITIFKNPIKTISKATFLKENEKIELEFPNQTFTILKLGFVGILLSLMLSLAIISSLFYLLNIIKKQKQIAEIKNDFISNITHEFKTPITTIGLATEALKVYSKEHNQIKTDEYLDITQNQVGKLNKMVEKVLETSVLEKDKLLLDKQPTDLVKLINQAVNKQFLSYKKDIKFNTDTDKLIVNLDAFHFENALNNLIDNAIKYGGNKIEISLKSTSENIIITISDNGKIKPEHKSKLFDKFYRIPKGNTHNVKGFGIGLYYTKKIIEKHQGNIEIANTSQTTFIIKLPKYEK